MALKKSQKSLKDWTAQKWRTKSGKKSSKTGERYLPEKAIKALSPSEYAATSRKKREDTKKGKQHSKQPKRIAKKTRAYRVLEYKKGGKAKKRDPRLARAGVSGYNKPKRTPKHPTKSHVVVAKQGDKIKTIRFGQQGVRGAGKNPKTAKDKARKRSYYARHNAQDANPSKLSARYWSHKVKW
jgi:serine/threonine protein kinase HipA of HipAB toxin-antitoxin module